MQEEPSNHEAGPLYGQSRSFQLGPPFAPAPTTYGYSSDARVPSHHSSAGSAGSSASNLPKTAHSGLTASAARPPAPHVPTAADTLSGGFYSTSSINSSVSSRPGAMHGPMAPDSAGPFYSSTVSLGSVGSISSSSNRGSSFVDAPPYYPPDVRMDQMDAELRWQRSVIERLETAVASAVSALEASGLGSGRSLFSMRRGPLSARDELLEPRFQLPPRVKQLGRAPAPGTPAAFDAAHIAAHPLAPGASGGLEVPAVVSFLTDIVAFAHAYGALPPVDGLAGELALEQLDGLVVAVPAAAARVAAWYPIPEPAPGAGSAAVAERDLGPAGAELPGPCRSLLRRVDTGALVAKAVIFLEVNGMTLRGALAWLKPEFKVHPPRRPASSNASAGASSASAAGAASSEGSAASSAGAGAGSTTGAAGGAGAAGEASGVVAGQLEAVQSAVTGLAMQLEQVLLHTSAAARGEPSALTALHQAFLNALPLPLAHASRAALLASPAPAMQPLSALVAAAQEAVARIHSRASGDDAGAVQAWLDIVNNKETGSSSGVALTLPVTAAAAPAGAGGAGAASAAVPAQAAAAPAAASLAAPTAATSAASEPLSGSGAGPAAASSYSLLGQGRSASSLGAGGYPAAPAMGPATAHAYALPQYGYPHSHPHPQPHPVNGPGFKKHEGPAAVGAGMGMAVGAGTGVGVGAGRHPSAGGASGPPGPGSSSAYPHPAYPHPHPHAYPQALPPYSPFNPPAAGASGPPLAGGGASRLHPPYGPASALAAPAAGYRGGPGSHAPQAQAGSAGGGKAQGRERHDRDRHSDHASASGGASGGARPAVTASAGADAPASGGAGAPAGAGSGTGATASADGSAAAAAAPAADASGDPIHTVSCLNCGGLHHARKCTLPCKNGMKCVYFSKKACIVKLHVPLPIDKP